MQINNRPVYNQGLVRNDSKGQQSIKKDAPTTDKVMDLTDTQNVEAELNTKDTQFLRIESKGEDVFLDLRKMEPKEKEALIGDLKHKVSGAQKFDDFDPKTFFQLTTKNSLVFGKPQTSAPTANIQSAQNVLDKSLTQGNTQQQNIFKVMNSDEKALDKSDAKEKVGDQNKPAEWYNGFQISQNEAGEYEVSTYISDEVTQQDGYDPTTQSYDLNTQGYQGKKGIDAYKSMLRDDFNFNGALTQVFKQADAELGPNATPAERIAHREEVFVESVVRKFSPQHPNLNDDQLKALAQNVWSYATVGTDKQGKMDIGEMQGMLKQLDPEMVKTGSNNGYSQYGKFTVTGEDGTQFSLPKGDPYHGRGTILQTRHLLESFKPEPAVRLDFATPPPELQGYQNTTLLADNSSSMGKHMQHLAGVIKAGGIEGNLNVGTFIDKDKPMIWSNSSGNQSSQAVKMSPSQAETMLDKQGQAHVEYSEAMQEYRKNPSEDYKALNQEVNTLETEVKNSKQRIQNFTKLLAEKPDHPQASNWEAALKTNQTNLPNLESQLEAKIKERDAQMQKDLPQVGSAFKYGNESMRESGILAGIEALEKAPNKSGSGPNTNQLILFTDETDASTPADLQKLQELAEAKGYDVKVVYTQVNVFENPDDDSFRIINVNEISDALSQSKRTTDAKTGNGAGALNWSQIAQAQNAPTYQWASSGL